MQKWIMSGLFFTACALAIVLMFSLPGKEEVAQENKSQMPEVTLNAEAAAAVVKANCINCHGEQLEGLAGPNLQTIGATMSTEELYKVIARGKGTMMPGFKDKLNDEEIANVALWLAEKK